MRQQKKFFANLSCLQESLAVPQPEKDFLGGACANVLGNALVVLSALNSHGTLTADSCQLLRLTQGGLSCVGTGDMR